MTFKLTYQITLDQSEPGAAGRVVTIVIVIGSLLVGGLVVAPLTIRSADWLVDHEPRWFTWWMGWIGGNDKP